MPMIAKIQELAESIRTQMLDAKVEMTVFTSGTAILDVHFHGRLFVMAYSPKWGFGVDEILDDDDIGTWYQYGFKDYESAQEKMIKLLMDSNTYN